MFLNARNLLAAFGDGDENAKRVEQELGVERVRSATGLLPYFLQAFNYEHVPKVAAGGDSAPASHQWAAAAELLEKRVRAFYRTKVDKYFRFRESQPASLSDDILNFSRFIVGDTAEVQLLRLFLLY